MPYSKNLLLIDQCPSYAMGIECIWEPRYPIPMQEPITKNTPSEFGPPLPLLANNTMRRIQRRFYRIELCVLSPNFFISFFPSFSLFFPPPQTTPRTTEPTTHTTTGTASQPSSEIDIGAVAKVVSTATTTIRRRSRRRRRHPLLPLPIPALPATLDIEKGARGKPRGERGKQSPAS